MARARARYTLEAEDRTDRGLRSAEGRLRGFGRVVSGAVTTAFAGVTAALAGWGAAIAASTRQLDDLAKRARDIQASLAEADAITLFAELQGSTAQQVFQGIDRFQDFLGRVRQGSKEARRELDGLGLSLQDFEGRSRFAQFLRFGVALQGVDPAQATRARRQAIGRGGARIFGGDFLEAAGRTGELDLSRNINELAARAEILNDLWTETTTILARARDELVLGGPGIESPFARGAVVESAATILRDAVAEGFARAGGGQFSGSQTLAGRRLETELQRLTTELQIQRAERGRNAGSVFGQ